MKAMSLLKCIFSVWLLSVQMLKAQGVAEVSALVAFGEKGTVTKVENPDPVFVTTGPSTAAPANAAKPEPKPVPPIQSVSTGADGATSLILTGAGTARMGGRHGGARARVEKPTAES